MYGTDTLGNQRDKLLSSSLGGGGSCSFTRNTQTLPNPLAYTICGVSKVYCAGVHRLLERRRGRDKAKGGREGGREGGERDKSKRRKGRRQKRITIIQSKSPLITKPYLAESRTAMYEFSFFIY